MMRISLPIMFYDHMHKAAPNMSFPFPSRTKPNLNQSTLTYPLLSSSCGT